MTGEIFDVYRLSQHDGPGMRTVLFTKGCPLRCRWCHNPESFRSGPEVWYFRDKCIGCGRCLEACVEKALSSGDGGIVIDRDKCTGCLACAEICPSKAMRSIGRDMTIEEAMKLLNREKPFMDNSGGGLTVSGGEPLLQSHFIKELFVECRSAGIHTALDTCGQVPWTTFEEVLPFTDMILYDLKIIDKNKHKEHTGTGNKRILENLDSLFRYVKENQPAPDIWIRTPLIPGATASEDNVRDIGSWLASRDTELINRWELCAFNPLATEKYKRLGMDWLYVQSELLTGAELKNLKGIAEESLGKSEKIYSSGLTSSE